MEYETLLKCGLCGGVEISGIDSKNNIWRCRLCGYIFDNPRPALKELEAFYSKSAKYDNWLENERERDRLWKRRLRKMKKNIKPGTLLDVGAGIGQFLYHSKPFFTTVFGTEISASAVEIARKKYGLEIRRGEMEKTDFGGALFDNITLFHVLEHVPNPKATIGKCKEILSPGGMLFIAVPNDIQSLKGKIKALLKGTGKYYLPKISLDGSQDEIHLSHFTAGVLKKFLERNGFEVIETSLDPYFVLNGVRKIIETFYYAACRMVYLLTGVNIYDTVWITAKKIQ